MKCDKTEVLEIEGLASLAIEHAAFDLRESIIIMPLLSIMPSSLA